MVTPKSNEKKLYDNHNSVETSLSDNDHYGRINSKYFDINEVNDLNINGKHFGTTNLNQGINNSFFDFQIFNNRLIYWTKNWHRHTYKLY